MISFGLEYAGIFLAKIKHEEHWKFDADEKKLISEALAHALSFRNIPISPETQAWLAVAGVTGGIIGSKMMASKLKKSVKGNPSEPAKPPENTATSKPGIFPFLVPDNEVNSD